jgi:hypothetical protein
MHTVAEWTYSLTYTSVKLEAFLVFSVVAVVARVPADTVATNFARVVRVYH